MQTSQCFSIWSLETRVNTVLHYYLFYLTDNKEPNLLPYAAHPSCANQLESHNTCCCHLVGEVRMTPLGTSSMATQKSPFMMRGTDSRPTAWVAQATVEYLVWGFIKLNLSACCSNLAFSLFPGEKFCHRLPLAFAHVTSAKINFKIEYIRKELNRSFFGFAPFVQFIKYSLSSSVISEDIDQIEAKRSCIRYRRVQGGDAS